MAMSNGRHLNSPLEEILSAFKAIQGSEEAKPVPYEKVKEWMGSHDIEALGALWAKITSDEQYYLRIEPPLTPKDYHEFLMHYFGRCLRENPAGQWSHTRYSAGGELVQWFVQQWNDTAVRRCILAELKEWLGRLYKEGDEALRTCIITATLEHLFEQPEIAEHFADWRDDAILRSAYDEAIEYAGHLREQQKYLDLKLDSVGEVIATRRLYDEKQAEIKVVIGKPQPFPDSPRYYCPYQITGIAFEPVQYAIGVDGIDAIQSAMEQIGAELNALNEVKGGKLRWEAGRQEDLGFPRPKVPY